MRYCPNCLTRNFEREQFESAAATDRAGSTERQDYWAFVSMSVKGILAMV
jgi:hypothetical protein